MQEACIAYVVLDWKSGLRQLGEHTIHFSWLGHSALSDVTFDMHSIVNTRL